MLQTKLVYVISLSFGMRCQQVDWMVPVSLMPSLGGRLFPTPLGRRRPRLLASPLSHLDASGTLRSVFIDGCFMAVSSSVEKFAMWW